MSSGLDEAKIKLSAALKAQKELSQKIRSLREYILTEEPKIDLNERNTVIYSKYKQGISISDLAEKFNLSKGRIRLICDWYKAKEARQMYTGL